MQQQLDEIISGCGITVSHAEPVHGGDINNTYCLYGYNTKYFLKLNDAQLYPSMFEKEAAGLHALQQEGMRVPGVIKHGIAGNKQYLLLEWIDKTLPAANFWEDFGIRLADMHAMKQEQFGWHEDNYIGSLKQVNRPNNHWHLFYANYRIMPLIKRLFDAGDISKQQLQHAENFCNKLTELFPGENPSLLHGDLWSGNFMVGPQGLAVVYDPAVYAGHREMDIGMSLLFGGFDQAFYYAYNQIFPMEKDWQQRVTYTQLYPLLVHAVLFGGHYIRQVTDTLKAF